MAWIEQKPGHALYNAVDAFLGRRALALVALHQMSKLQSSKLLSSKERKSVSQEREAMSLKGNYSLSLFSLKANVRLHILLPRKAPSMASQIPTT